MDLAVSLRLVVDHQLDGHPHDGIHGSMAAEAAGVTGLVRRSRTISATCACGWTTCSATQPGALLLAEHHLNLCHRLVLVG